MSAPFTPRQGAYLAFIQRFIEKKGVAPSFEEIAAHFGTSAPSVNGMIKTLEKRGLLSREPGVARSLKVLVPPSVLPGSDYGTASKRGVSAPEAAATAAIAVMKVFLKEGGDITGDLVSRASSALRQALVEGGLRPEEARQAAQRVDAAFSRPGRSG